MLKWNIRNKILLFCIIPTVLLGTSTAHAQVKYLTLAEAQQAAVNELPLQDLLDTIGYNVLKQEKEIKDANKDIEKALENNEEWSKYQYWVDNKMYKEMKGDLKAKEAFDFLIMLGIIPPQSKDPNTYRIHKDDPALVLSYFKNEDLLVLFYRMNKVFAGRFLSTEQVADLTYTQNTTKDIMDAAAIQQRASVEIITKHKELAVQKKYADTLIAEEEYHNSKSKVDEIDKLYNKYTLLFNKGMVSHIDYEKTKIEKSIKENEFKIAERNCRAAYIVLKKEIGISIEQDVQLSGQGMIMPMKEYATQEILNKYRVQNLTLNTIKQTKVIPAQRKAEIAKQEATYRQEYVRDAEEAYLRAQLEFEIQMNKMESSIRQQVVNIRNIRRSIKEIQRSIESFQLDKDIIKLQKEIGLVTELEVLKVDNVYRDLETSLQNLMYTESYMQKMLELNIQY